MPTGLLEHNYKSHRGIQQPARAHPNAQYLKHFKHPSIALPVSPSLQSMKRGAQKDQQQELQNKYAN